MVLTSLPSKTAISIELQRFLISGKENEELLQYLNTNPCYHCDKLTYIPTGLSIDDIMDDLSQMLKNSMKDIGYFGKYGDEICENMKAIAKLGIELRYDDCNWFLLQTRKTIHGIESFYFY